MLLSEKKKNTEGALVVEEKVWGGVTSVKLLHSTGFRALGHELS